jgi:predicted ester cyclase
MPNSSATSSRSLPASCWRSVAACSSNIAEGDRFPTYAVWSALNSGSFNGIPASGKRAEMEIFILYRIRESKIVEHCGHPDTMGLLMQIGALPAAA